VTTPIIKASPTVISVGPTPLQICPAVGSPVMVYNADLTNTAYLGYSADLSPFNGTAVPALTYTVMDGSRQLWGVCPTGTVALNITPGGTYQSASAAQIAEQITLSGLNYAQPESLLATLSIPAGGTWGASTITFPTGVAYEVVLAPVVAADPFVTDLQITHLLNGTVLYREAFTVSNMPGTNNQFVRVRGNLHGNQLAISGISATSAFINTITGGAFTAGAFTATILSLSSPIAATSPKVSLDTFIEFGTQAALLIAAESAAVGASANAIMGMLQSCTGEAYLNISSNTGGGFNVVPSIYGYTVFGGTTAVYVKRFPQVGGSIAVTGATTAALITPFGLTGYWYRLNMFNTSAVAGTVNYNIAGRDWT
jgi:hypothetical protein